MSSFDLRKFLTENKLTPNTQGYKIILEEKKPVQKEAFAPINRKGGNRKLSEGALEGDPSTWKQLPSKGSPDRQHWDDLWRTIATYTRDRKLNVRKIINGGGHIRISFKDGSELRIGPGILQFLDRNTYKRTKIGPENAAIVCKRFDNVGVRHLTFNDPANHRGGAMNHKEVSPLNEGKRRNLSEAEEGGTDSLVNQAKAAFKKEVFDNRRYSVNDRIGEYHTDEYRSRWTDQLQMGNGFTYPVDDLELELAPGCYASFVGEIEYSTYPEDDGDFEVEVTGWTVDCVILQGNPLQGQDVLAEFDWDSDEEECLWRESKKPSHKGMVNEWEYADYLLSMYGPDTEEPWDEEYDEDDLDDPEGDADDLRDRLRDEPDYYYGES